MSKVRIRAASYGGGMNSTAMIIECFNRGIPIDIITFADTGGEKPHTYKYLEIFGQWLAEHGMPEITIVKKGGRQETLEENCLRMNMLPSLAYGFKGCSMKYKIEPQEKFFNNWPPAKDVWGRGDKVIKLIGYDADEERRAGIAEDKKYTYEYPLIEWGMGRDECEATITTAGLCLPGKSACFFCPASRPAEIKSLKELYPELAERALAMESNANLTDIKGLGRNFAWKDVIATDDMFADHFHLAPEMLCGCFDG